MFTKLVAWIKSLPHLILPNPNWKKVAWAAGLGVAAFLVVWKLLPLVLSQKIVAAGAGVGVAWVVYTRVAMWEIERAIKVAQDVSSKVEDVVKDATK